MSTWSTSDPVLIGDSGPSADGSTKTQAMLRCPKIYQYAYERGVLLPKSTNPSYFTVGSIFGAGRAAWFGMKFASGVKAWEKIKRAVQKEAERSKLPMRPEDEAYGLALVELYLEHWIKRPLPRCVAIEYPVGPVPLFKRTGRLDDLSYYPTGLGGQRFQFCIGEAKTTSGDIATAIKEYEFHTQTLQYEALFLLDPQGAARFGKVDGHMFDICQKPEGKGKKPKFARAFIEIREESLYTFVKSTNTYIRAQEQIKWDSAPVRTYQCTFQAGRARVDCAYKPLCRYGKAAVGGYIMADGTKLTAHKPVEGKEKMPWE